MLRASLATLGLVVLCSAPASAQSEAPLTGNLPGKFTLNAGGLLGANLDTKLRLDSRSGSFGTTIDMEDVLGLDATAQSFSGQITFRPHRRHQLAVSYYALKRTNAKAIDRDISLGDTTWTLNTRVSSTFNTNYATLSYRWSTILSSRVNLGIGIGIPVVFASTELSAKVTNTPIVTKRSEDVTVPVPLPGLHATVRMTRNLYLDGHAQYLKINAFDIEADVVDWQAVVHYYPLRALGVAGGVVGNSTSIKGDSSDFDAKLTYDILGASLYVTWIP